MAAGNVRRFPLTHPGTSFDVYLARKGDPASRQHVGTITWFAAFRRAHGGGKEPAQTFRYDVTDELRDLGGEAAAGGLIVIIEASDGMENADPEQAETMKSEAAAAFRADSDLKIGAIELHAVPP